MKEKSGVIFKNIEGEHLSVDGAINIYGCTNGVKIVTIKSVNGLELYTFYQRLKWLFTGK